MDLEWSAEQILMHLAKHPSKTRRELADEVGWDQVVTDDSVAKLHAAKLLTKRDQLSSDSLYTLTAAGAAKAQEIECRERKLTRDEQDAPDRQDEDRE